MYYKSLKILESISYRNYFGTNHSFEKMVHFKVNF